MAEFSVLFVGLGSIGRRHLRNLHVVSRKLGLDVTVEALRHAGGALEPDVAGLLSAQHMVSSSLKDSYDIVFVCNPSQMHVETLHALKDKGRFFFVEKPVAVEPISEPMMRSLGDPRRYCVACPLRHSLVYEAIRDFTARNRVLSARALCTSYLPEWRSKADYRRLYSARRDSGGVKVDLIHEFDYLFSLFGFPETACLLERKVSNLEIECSDVAVFAAMYPKMSLEVHLDYFGRKAERTLRLWTPDDIVEFDFIGGTQTSLRTGASSHKGDASFEAAYLREMERFVRFANGDGENVNDLCFANGVLSEVFSAGRTVLQTRTEGWRA